MYVLIRKSLDVKVNAETIIVSKYFVFYTYILHIYKYEMYLWRN